MNTDKIRVLFVDDNKRLISAWERLFAQQPDMKLVGVLDRADLLPVVAKAQNAEVVLIDLTMSGRDPLDAVTELKATCPDIRALIYSAHSRSAWHERVHSAGADGFLDKAQEPSIVLETIRRVARGTANDLA